MGSDSSKNLRAGAGKAPIDLPKGVLASEGLSGVHDPLHARVLILQSGPSVALVSLELTSLPEERVVEFQSLVSEVTGLAPENVWVIVTHTLSTPHFVPAYACKTKADSERNRLLADVVGTALREAASLASGSIQEVRLGHGSGVCDVNVNRDVPTADGWWLGLNESGCSDKTLSVLRLETLSGDPLALLFTHSVRPAVMERPPGTGDSGLVTADLAGAACDLVEREYVGAVAMFFMGAAGDQSPSVTGARCQYVGKDGHPRIQEGGDRGHAVAEMVGARLGAAVVGISEEVECWMCTGPLVPGRTSLQFGGQEPVPTPQVRPTEHHEFTPGPERSETVETVVLGDVALVGVRPELSCSTGKNIRQRSPFPETLVLTMVNGGAKYMPDADSYERITYEAMSSPFACGSAETLAEGINHLLLEMRG